MSLEKNVEKELIKYNLLSDLNNIFENNMLGITKNDINSLLNSDIKAYFNDYCNNNADFLVTVVSNIKPKKCLLHIEENGFSIDLLEQTLNRIRTSFGEDIEVVFSRKETNSLDKKILFIAC